nr:UDP-glycosyltransferase 92A1-like [Ipomoea batatas]
MAGNSHQHHIVMLPFMAQGHMIPFLALAKKIHETTSFTITIATTPLNAQYLRTTISAEGSKSPPSPGIRVADLSFNPADHGLESKAENTEALAFDDMLKLFRASVSLESPLRDLISEMMKQENGKPPLCIISDSFMGWANRVAKSFGTVNVSFNTGGCYGFAAYFSCWLNLPHLSAKDDEFSLPGFPGSTRFHISQLHPLLRAANATDPWTVFYRSVMSLSFDSFGWLCNTVKEIEPAGTDILKSIIKLPVWCIGPLLPPEMLDKTRELELESSQMCGTLGRNPGISARECIGWLDMHRDGLVLYVSFGSQNSISASQMMALALGLEDSQKPFLWVIRPPIGFDRKGEFRPEWLPEGYEERMGKTKKGLLVHSWAPQLEILCHRSVGAFLSHCGWNSLLESLSQGVPIIGWPLSGDQGFNSKMLMEETGVCIEVCRGTQSSVSREDVKRVVNIVLEKGGEGEEMKKKAIGIGEMIRGAVREDGSTKGKGSSLLAMDDFVRASLPEPEPLPRALAFQILSTSSNVSPFVSGTKATTNPNAATAITASIKNVAPVPTASANERKLCATMRLDIQLTVADIPPHIPRYASGYISEFTVHGTGPIPGAKKAM